MASYASSKKSASEEDAAHAQRLKYAEACMKMREIENAMRDAQAKAQRQAAAEKARAEKASASAGEASSETTGTAFPGGLKIIGGEVPAGLKVVAQKTFPASEVAAAEAGGSAAPPTSARTVGEDAGARGDGVVHLKSKLGTLDHWDEHYERELRNFGEDEDDEGVDWFSENIGNRLLEYVEEHAPLSGGVLDLGCGSGIFLLDVAAGVDGGRFLGVDYSAAAVALAKDVAAKREVGSCEFRVADITKLEALEEQFMLVLDKGTFDAYMLGDDSSVAAYATSVARALHADGIFLLTSCNNTAEELVAHFTSDHDCWGGPSRFAEHDRVKYPTFQFGGVKGAAVATVAFRLVR